MSALHGQAAQPGHVYLCGAGPGDPELLTLRALRLLQTADVILPDALVSPEILALAGAQAKVIPVGKRCGRPGITQAGIHELMVQHAGGTPARSVLRLKSGDPLVFGRAAEEMDALTEARIPFEIVPGVTTAFAAAARLQTPLTDRSAAAALTLATAHHSASRSAAGEKLFPAPLDPRATLALYMPGRDLHRLRDELLEAGLPPGTPVAAISRATTPHERLLRTTVAALCDEQPGPAPLLLLIGDAIRG